MQQAPWEMRENRQGRQKTWKKGGFAEIKIKAGLFFFPPTLPVASPSTVCSAAPARHPLAEGSSVPPRRGIRQIQPQLARKWVNPILPSGKGKQKPGGDGTMQKKPLPPQNEGEMKVAFWGMGRFLLCNSIFFPIMHPTLLNTCIYSKQQPGLNGNTHTVRWQLNIHQHRGNIPYL